MIMACFNFMNDLRLAAFVEGVVSVIWACVAVGARGVRGHIWTQQVLSARRVEPVETNPDRSAEHPGSDSSIGPNGAGCNSINASVLLHKRSGFGQYRG